MRKRMFTIIVIVALIAIIMSVVAYQQWQAYEYEFEHGMQGPLGNRKAAKKHGKPELPEHKEVGERTGEQSQ